MGGAMSGAPNSRPIRTPGELSAILRELKQAMASGELEPTEPSVPSFASDTALADIPEDGPWPDYFELHFLAPNTGQRYKLSVETYHGTGGMWSEE